MSASLMAQCSQHRQLCTQTWPRSSKSSSEATWVGLLRDSRYGSPGREESSKLSLIRDSGEGRAVNTFLSDPMSKPTSVKLSLDGSRLVWVTREAGPMIRGFNICWRRGLKGLEQFVVVFRGRSERSRLGGKCRVKISVANFDQS